VSQAHQRVQLVVTKSELDRTLCTDSGCHTRTKHIPTNIANECIQGRQLQALGDDDGRARGTLPVSLDESDLTAVRRMHMASQQIAHLVRHVQRVVVGSKTNIRLLLPVRSAQSSSTISVSLVGRIGKHSAPDEGVDLRRLDIVELLHSVLDLTLVRLNVDDEDKGVVLLNLLHCALCVEWPVRAYLNPSGSRRIFGTHEMMVRNSSIRGMCGMDLRG
jgi:hypothetical protein